MARNFESGPLNPSKRNPEKEARHYIPRYQILKVLQLRFVLISGLTSLPRGNGSEVRGLHDNQRFQGIHTDQAVLKYQGYSCEHV